MQINTSQQLKFGFFDQTKTVVNDLENFNPSDTFDRGWQAIEDFTTSNFHKLQHLFSAPQSPPGLGLDTENDIKTDGFIFGAGDSFDKSDPNGVSPVRPNNGKIADETVFLVNGIMTDEALQRSDMQVLANTGKDVIGIHNATAGLVYDLAQCLDDKAGTGFSDNKATVTATNVMYDAVRSKKPIHMIGHSQGALVVCNAVSETKARLLKSGMSEAQAEEALASVKITTFGGAARFYPDGPDYTHVINHKDLVPMGTGLGMVGNGGKGAKIHAIDVMAEPHDLPEARASVQNWLARYVDRTTHGPQDIYFNHAPWVENDQQELGLFA